MNKIIYIGSNVLVLVGAIWILSIASSAPETEEISSQPSPTIVVEEQYEEEDVVTVSINFGDGDRSRGTVQADTVFDALFAVTVAEGMILDYTEYDFGMLVTMIDGYENSDTRAWIYYVDGVGADRAADQYELSGGELIEWNYESIDAN